MFEIKDYSKIHLEKCWTENMASPCEDGCPAGINIPGFIMALAKGEVADAYAIVRDAMPVGGSLGRICHHPCESDCNRSLIDQPIDVMRLKRYAFDAGRRPFENITARTKLMDTKVAIVGSGPAGLTAADLLNRMGYRVTIFEADSSPGGMLFSSIPTFNLPQKIVSTEIDDLLRSGIVIKTGIELGKNATLKDLERSGYRAILIATGAPRSQMLDLPGKQLEGITPALTFLKDVKRGKIKRRFGNVVIIGGGNVAMDAARSAVRLGADSTSIACLESFEEMPAFADIIAESKLEGIRIINSIAPQRFLPSMNSRKIGKVEFQKVSRVFSDEHGNLHWDLSKEPDAQVILYADAVIVAIGQALDLRFLEEIGAEKDARGRVLVDEKSQMTSCPGTFLAGDVTTGRGTAVDAVTSGKSAALAIHRFLASSGTSRKGVPVVESALNYQEVYRLRKEMIPQFVPKKKRWKTIRIPTENRIRSFEEADLGFSHIQAMEEAKRCLNCKQCGSCIFDRGQICFDQSTRILA